MDTGYARRERRFLLRWCIPIEALALFLALLAFLYTALQVADTHDEYAHLNTGLRYWADGKANLDPIHPIFRAIYALPGSFFRPPAPRDFLDRIHPDIRLAILQYGRAVAAFLYVAFAWGFGRLVRRWIGPAAGLAALVIALSCTTVGSHAMLCATDVPALVGTFLVAAALYEWHLRPRWTGAVLLGMASGLCLLTKYSTIAFGLGLAVSLAAALTERAIAAHRRGGGAALRGFVLLRGAHLFLAAIVALAVIGAPYKYKGVGRPFGHFKLEGNGPAARLAHALPGVASPLPRVYLAGIDEVVSASAGRTHYFHGKFYSGQGELDIAYYPVLLLAKPPLVLHLLVLAGVAWYARRWSRRRGWLALLVAIPYAGFLAYMIFGTEIRLGVRHIFPLFPLAWLLAAYGATRWVSPLGRLVGGALVASLAILLFSLLPHQLAYFNPVLGGTSGAWRWYSDSNQDWGQGAYEIHRYAEANRMKVDLQPKEGKSTGWVAVNTGRLVGEFGNDPYRWLREGFTRDRFVAPYWHVYFIPEDHWKSRPQP